MASVSVKTNDNNNAQIPTERFLDFVDEPTVDLAPIKGYEKAALVSLEEAIEPIEHLLDNVAADIWIARRNCKKPHDGLTTDESAAIYLYSMDSLYRQLNAALRNKDRRSLDPWFPYLKLYLTALWKLPDERHTIWRGVKADISDQFSEGETFIWWGFSSCTTSLKQAERFLGRTGARTLFNIDSTHGKLIQNHSHHPAEREVLLLPCSYFEVLGCINQGNGLRIIHIRQTEPPVPLIRPPFDTSMASRSVSQKPTTVTSAKAETNLFTNSSRTASVASAAQTWRALREKPRLRLSIDAKPEVMSSNDKYLVYCREGGFCVIDHQGRNKLDIEDTGRVLHMCWSSFLDRFLILYPSSLYSLNVANAEVPVRIITEFPTMRLCCTCNEDTFFVYTPAGQFIEEYNMSNWKLCKTFKPPMSCGVYDCINAMRFNSDGSRLGVVIERCAQKNESGRYLFELRNPYDNMKVLQIVELAQNFCGGLLALPKQQFLVHFMLKNKFYLIDSSGRLKETIQYEAERIGSTALINENCLVIQTDTDLLRFYDL